VRRLELSESATADLKSIRRYSLRAWGDERTERYMVALRDTMKSLVSGRAVGREREDLRPRLRMAASGRHSVFFEVDGSNAGTREQNLSCGSPDLTLKANGPNRTYYWPLPLHHL